MTSLLLDIGATVAVVFGYLAVMIWSDTARAL
jgi:hypothetical protein